MKDLPRFIVVVHADSPEQAQEQSKIAFDNGAEGIFLINHSIKHTKLVNCYSAVRYDYPDKFIGMNFLDLDAYQAVSRLPDGADALWMDDPLVHSERDLDRAYYVSSYAEEKGAGKTWRTFSSVAFKYQRHDPKPEWSAAMAEDLFDIVVTSGAATGSPAEVEKIKSMYYNMSNRFNLALASGVDIHNVKSYDPYISCFMVASSISNPDDTLNPDKVRELAYKIQYGL